MTNSVNNTESTTESTETKVDKAPDTTLDDMYSEEKVEESKEEEKEEKTVSSGYDTEEESKEESKEDDTEEKIKDPASGYDKEESKEEPKEDDKEEKKPEEELKVILKELPENINQDSVLKFAVDNKMNKEQVEAYVKLAKDSAEQAKIEYETQVKETRKSWKNELMTDKDFGGENFDRNVHKVEKLLENNMPNTKKVLTDRGSMLPPSTMKDLLGIYNLLNPKTKLVNGDPSKVEPEGSGNFLDDMYK